MDYREKLTALEWGWVYEKTGISARRGKGHMEPGDEKRLKVAAEVAVKAREADEALLRMKQVEEEVREEVRSEALSAGVSREDLELAEEAIAAMDDAFKAGKGEEEAKMAMAGAMAKVRGRSMSKEGARRREDKESGDRRSRRREDKKKEKEEEEEEEEKKEDRDKRQREERERKKKEEEERRRKEDRKLERGTKKGRGKGRRN